MTKQTKKPGKKHASEASVLARAKRLARAELKKVAEALGLENFDEATFQAKLAELKSARESGMGDAEKHASRVRELESKLLEQKRAVLEAKTQAARLQKQIKQVEVEKTRSSIEAKIAEAAKLAGVRDSNYATHLFREHVLSNGAHKSDPNLFFESLKKETDKAFLFEPKTVGAGVQQKLPRADAHSKIETTQPEPKINTGAPEEKDTVDEMNPAEFAKRTREKYGFRPTMLGA